MQRALEMPAEKIIQLNAALAHHAIPFAFGGAIARNYYADIRTATDIDAGIFLPPRPERTGTLGAYHSLPN